MHQQHRWIALTYIHVYEELNEIIKMAKAKKVHFKYAFGHFFRSHELLDLFGVYKFF